MAGFLDADGLAFSFVAAVAVDALLAELEA